jgi:hypothetical protein
MYVPAIVIGCYTLLSQPLQCLRIPLVRDLGKPPTIKHMHCTRPTKYGMHEEHWLIAVIVSARLFIFQYLANAHEDWSTFASVMAAVLRI